MGKTKDTPTKDDKATGDQITPPTEQTHQTEGTVADQTQTDQPPPQPELAPTPEPVPAPEPIPEPAPQPEAPMVISVDDVALLEVKKFTWVRMLVDKEVEGALYKVNQIVAFAKAMADSLVQSGEADDSEAAIKYCLEKLDAVLIQHYQEEE